MKKKVLLICTGNCCRSPMAEGIWKKLAGDHWEVYSAGSSPTGYLHPLAIEAMAIKKIDISQQTSKSISELPVDHFDVAITLCNNARDNLPVLPADKILHWPVADPFFTTGSDEIIINSFHKTAEELTDLIKDFLASEKSLCQ